MIDIRAATGDNDRAVQVQRGYDENGHPLCPHGSPLRSNGHDYERRRTTWCCEKQCEKEGSPPDCPYRTSGKHGYTVHVGWALPDGTVRLAREIPYDTPYWSTRFGRRNLSESRNGSMERLGMKRLPGHGLSQGRKEVALADLLINLQTLGRLVQEATLLAGQQATG